MIAVNGSFVPTHFFDPLLLPLAKSSSEHAFLNKFKNPPTFGAHRDQVPLIQRIQDFCLLLLKVAIFLVSQNLFVFGFLTGIAMEEFSPGVVQKISSVYQNQPTLNKVVWVVAGLMAGQFVLLTVCFLTAANIGARHYRELKFD